MTDGTDDYWPTERVVAEIQADRPDLDADEIERVLSDLESEGIVRYEPGHGWYLPSVARALAVLAKHDPAQATRAAGGLLRDRLTPARRADARGGDDET